MGQLWSSRNTLTPPHKHFASQPYQKRSLKLLNLLNNILLFWKCKPHLCIAKYLVHQKQGSYFFLSLFKENWGWQILKVLAIIVFNTLKFRVNNWVFIQSIWFPKVMSRFSRGLSSGSTHDSASSTFAFFFPNSSIHCLVWADGWWAHPMKFLFGKESLYCLLTIQDDFFKFKFWQ